MIAENVSPGLKKITDKIQPLILILFPKSLRKICQHFRNQEGMVVDDSSISNHLLSITMMEGNCPIWTAVLEMARIFWDCYFFPPYTLEFRPAVSGLKIPFCREDQDHQTIVDALCQEIFFVLRAKPLTKSLLVPFIIIKEELGINTHWKVATQEEFLSLVT